MSSSFSHGLALGVGVGVMVGAGAALLLGQKRTGPHHSGRREVCPPAPVKQQACTVEREGADGAVLAQAPVPTTAGGSTGEDPGLMAEQLSRNKLFFGERGQARVSGAFVVVVGLGGVGSHAAHMLARAGVGKLRLIDFDQVSLSSLNRHAVATRADVGRPKVMCCADAFAAFNPNCAVEPRAVKFEAGVAAELLAGSPDYVVDAIDDVPTKAALLVAAAAAGIPVVSALGAGAKADPTRILVGALGETTNDPLVRGNLPSPAVNSIRCFNRTHSSDRWQGERRNREWQRIRCPEDTNARSLVGCWEIRGEPAWVS